MNTREISALVGFIVLTLINVLLLPGALFLALMGVYGIATDGLSLRYLAIILSPIADLSIIIWSGLSYYRYATRNSGSAFWKPVVIATIPLATVLIISFLIRIFSR